MVKLLHVSDCGLKNLPYGGINPETGLNRRFEDIVNSFKYSMKVAAQNNCKYFVIAGDINEERNPDSFIVEQFSSFVADLISVGIKVIIVPGNHDLDSSRATSTSVSFIKALGLVNTYVADLKPQTFEFEDARFICIPYMFPHQAGVSTNEELTIWLNDKIRKVKISENKPNILVTHYSLETTFAGLSVNEPVIYIDELSKFDYVALGHIHKYQMFDSFVGGYTGSMFTKDFGEDNDKYVNVVEFGADRIVKISKVQLPERKFIQFNIDALELSVDETIDELKSQIETYGSIDGAVVKVRISARSRFDPKLLYAVLRDEKVFHYTPIDWKIAREDVARKIDSNAKTDTDIVDSYFKKYPDKDPNGSVAEYISTTISRWADMFA